MNNLKIKIASIVSVVSVLALGIASKVGATIVPLPAYEDVMNQTTTAFAGSLFTDLLPWVGALLGLVIAALLLVALRRGIAGGIKRVFGGGRRGRGRRGRR